MCLWSNDNSWSLPLLVAVASSSLCFQGHEQMMKLRMLTWQSPPNHFGIIYFILKSTNFGRILILRTLLPSNRRSSVGKISMTSSGQFNYILHLFHFRHWWTRLSKVKKFLEPSSQEFFISPTEHIYLLHVCIRIYRLNHKRQLYISQGSLGLTSKLLMVLMGG